jgi:PTH1 family peptidyl-tRNA hydrolase
MRMLVGLGNPGSEFAGTRHNIGWEAVDRLAGRLGWTGKKEEFNKAARTKFDGLAMDGSVSIHSGGSEKLLLLKPTTFMNDSGRSVQAAMAFYQLSPVDLLVVLDDLALPCGKIRIRPGGSSGGHNGLKDIQRVLGTDEYPRLRIGIDSPPPRIPGRDYVLGRFTEEQRVAVDPAIDRAAQAILKWIEDGIETAMNLFNADAREE